MEVKCPASIQTSAVVLGSRVDDISCILYDQLVTPNMKFLFDGGSMVGSITFLVRYSKSLHQFFHSNIVVVMSTLYCQYL